MASAVFWPRRTGQIGAVGEKWPALPIARRPAIAVLVAHHPYRDGRRLIMVMDRGAASREQCDVDNANEQIDHVLISGGCSEAT